MSLAAANPNQPQHPAAIVCMTNAELTELTSQYKELPYVRGVSGVRLKTDDMMGAPAIADRLASRLRGDYYVRDWSAENRNWFAAVQIEKRMMFIILTLIVAVAAFNASAKANTPCT